MFVVWDAMGKFYEVSVTQGLHFSVVCNGLSPSQREDIFIWIFPYKPWNVRILYTYVFKVSY